MKDLINFGHKTLTLSKIVAIGINNLIPILGVYFLGWHIYYVVFLMWLEIVILSIVSLCKTIAAQSMPIVGSLDENLVFGKWSKARTVFFSVVYYPIILFGLGSLLYLVDESMPVEQLLLGSFSSSGSLYPLLSMLFTYGIVFYVDFIVSGKYKTSMPQKEAENGILYIIVGIMTIFTGAYISGGESSSVPPIVRLVGIVVFKIFIELTYLLENKSNATMTSVD
ncbi:MAG: DUF6498-containing protein [bacterium]|nr:DUF6498-containing protein [bacterium]